jgi:hypothetical protein
MSTFEKLGACPEHFEVLRSALDHIVRTARNSSTSTRRTRWIAARAQMALDGKPYSDAMFDLPKVDNSSPERRIQRLNYRVRVLLASLTEMAADVEATARASYGRSPETALDDWRAAEPEQHALWLRAREAMSSAVTEPAPNATTTGDPQ